MTIFCRSAAMIMRVMRNFAIEMNFWLNLYLCPSFFWSPSDTIPQKSPQISINQSPRTSRRTWSWNSMLIASFSLNKIMNIANKSAIKFKIHWVKYLLFQELRFDCRIWILKWWLEIFFNSTGFKINNIIWLILFKFNQVLFDMGVHYDGINCVLME